MVFDRVWSKIRLFGSCALLFPLLNLLGEGAKSSFDEPVVVQRTIEPFYPNWAYNNGIGEGFAKFAFYVDEKGNASDFLAIEYSYEPFADSLGKALPKWKFKPAHKFGKPVKSVCHAYWEFYPDRAIQTNAFFDTGNRMKKSNPHNHRELRYLTEKKLDQKIRMVSFPEVIAPTGFDRSLLQDGKIKVRCQFFVDTEGSATLPVIVAQETHPLENEMLSAFKEAIFERPLHKGEPTVAWLDKTYLIQVTVP